MIVLLFLILQAPERPLLRDLMGINGHTVQFKPDFYAPVARLARDYHPVDWDLGGDTAKLPDFPFAKNRVDWSAVYGSWKKHGWDVDACLMFDSMDPRSWRDLAPYAGAFARAFGPGSARPLVDSVEIGNEPGKYDDATYRALFEAAARAIRAADPKLTIATCNVADEKSGDYHKSVSCVEGLHDLYDVINVHTYAMLEEWPTWRRGHPESAKLRDYLPRVQKLIAWRDAKAPGKKIWITEFGWDAATGKPGPGDFEKWVGSTDVEQARYLVRSFLLFSAMPVNRAYLFFFNDEDEAKLHAASGLTRRFEPKPSFHAVAHLKKALGDYRFKRAVRKEVDALYVYEYIHADGRLAWAVWSPTGSNRAVDVTLTGMPGRAVRAERMALKAGPPEAVEIGAGPLRVDESPLFIWFP